MQVQPDKSKTIDNYKEESVDSGNYPYENIKESRTAVRTSKRFSGADLANGTLANQPRNFLRRKNVRDLALQKRRTSLLDVRNQWERQQNLPTTSKMEPTLKFELDLRVLEEINKIK